MLLNTDRLLLEEFTIDDLNFLHHINSQPEVDQYNTLGIPENIQETQLNLQRFIDAQNISPRASYNWKIRTKKSEINIGVAGMNVSNNRFKLGEIYYNFLPEFWGKGYATEIGKRLVKFGFDDLKLHKIEAGVQIENFRSIRVLEKLGMTREGLRRKILPIRGEWKDNYHYAIVEDDPIEY